MYYVTGDCENNYFFNKKENAVKRAIEIFNDFVFENVNSIKEWNEDYAGVKNDYEDTCKKIKTGNYSDDWVTIQKIETED